MSGIVIIGGLPRSGTRQFCDIMNACPSFMLLGEMMERAFCALGDFVAAADKREGHWSEEAYRQRRLEFVLETYRGASKAKNLPVLDISRRFLGFKQPLVERHHDVLKKLFAPSVERLSFFYCLRNIRRNYLSLSGAFGYTPEVYKRRVTASIRAVQAMAKDDLFQIRPLFLDQFVSAGDRGEWVVANIFQPLGLDTNRAEAGQYIQSTRNRNRTPDPKRRTEMTPEEEAELFGDKGFVRDVEWLAEQFQVQLLD